MFSEEPADRTDREQQSSHGLARAEQTSEPEGSAAVEHRLQTTDCVEVEFLCSRRTTRSTTFGKCLQSPRGRQLLH